MSEKQFSTFYLDDALFGIDILVIREINRHLDMTKVHQVAEHVRGLLTLRGQIITMLDLGVKLGLEPRSITPESRGIILKTHDEILAQGIGHMVNEQTGTDQVGLLVDRVGDVGSVKETEIDSPPANIGEINGKYFSGVVKLDGELLSILKISEIIS